MKKFVLVMMVIVSMATGCANEDAKEVSSMDEIKVNEIQVKGIEVKTWDNIDIETFD